MKGRLGMSFPGDQEGNNGRLMVSVYINIPMGKCPGKRKLTPKIVFGIENMMMNQGILADETKCWHITFHVDFRCFSHLQDKCWMQLTTFLAWKMGKNLPPSYGYVKREHDQPPDFSVPCSFSQTHSYGHGYQL